MKNRTVGFIYFSIDVICSTIVLISVSTIVRDPLFGEYAMIVVLPIAANVPISLVVVPWIKNLTERSEWVILIAGLSLGCIQAYFIGWISAWAFKHKRQKAPWGWILFIIFAIWSFFMGCFFMMSALAFGH